MKTIFTYLLLVVAFFVNAQDGTLDTAFGTNGKVDFNNFYSSSMKFDRDGKILAIGSFDGDPAIARINKDGSLDTTFNGTGISIIDVAQSSGTVASSAVDIIVYENYYLVSVSTYCKVFKLLKNGMLDTSFGINGIYEYSTGFNSGVYSLIAGKPDGSFIIARQAGPAVRNVVLFGRLANGGVDPNYNAGNPVNLIFSTETAGNYTSLNGFYIDENDFTFISAIKNKNSTIGKQNICKKVSNNGLEQAYDYSNPIHMNWNGSAGYHKNIDGTSYFLGISNTAPFSFAIVKIQL